MYDVIDMPDLVSRYFSSNLWLGAFIVSVIYLFFRLNNAGKRALFAAVVAFFLVVNVFVIRLFTALNENDTFYRNLWAIPSVTIIGIAMVDLVRMMPRWFLKIPAIVAIAIFLYFSNQEYIRCRDQIFSADAKMVPNDIILLGQKLEELREESEKKVIFIVCPASYSRSYGDFRTELNIYSGNLYIFGSSLLDDGSHNGEEELTKENPDVEYIMSKCCTSGIDYLVVSKHENTKEQFYNFGYKPEIVADSYIVYKCTGFCGYKQDLNNYGQIAVKALFDEEDKPRSNGKYSIIKYTYSRNKTREEYCDEQGNPIKSVCGYTAYEREVDNQEQLVSLTYYDIHGKILGETNERGTSNQRMFQFTHCSDETNIINNDSLNISMRTRLKDNKFGPVFFVLYNVTTGNDVIFGKANNIGEISGEYRHELESGLYRLRLKTNSTLSDEWIQSYEYLEKGDIIKYSYNIDIFTHNYIKISNICIYKDVDKQ